MTFSILIMLTVGARKNPKQLSNLPERIKSDLEALA